MKLLAEMVIGGEGRKAFDVQKLKFWSFERITPKGSSGHWEHRRNRKRNESRQTGKGEQGKAVLEQRVETETREGKFWGAWSL